MNTLLLTDFYKVHHNKMYPKGMTKLYSNFTPRKSRVNGVDKVVFFGLQAFIKEYLITKFNDDFFGSALDRRKDATSFRGGKDIWDYKKYDVLKEYSEEINVDVKHIEALWDLGYLPIEIKALEEGTLCPIGVPCFTITNTHEDFGWLTNYLETLISCQMWQPITSATIAHQYYKLLSKFAIETTGTNDFVQWQGHDFSMRGMSSVESAILSGMGHLTSFTGTDTIPAIYGHKKYYNATGLIGASVPATEHSVMCMGVKEDEINTFLRLLQEYPTGILSVVSDTWNLWTVLTEYLPRLKERILSRDGKLVIRPDSGDPVDIICGTKLIHNYNFENETPEEIGVIGLLWKVFGGTKNEKGFIELDSHIGAIYGDSITLERAEHICLKLARKGFASTNIVLGIGSYTYQYNTRDTFGFAMKATYGEVIIDAEENGVVGMKKECREIFKDPITDDGTKRSKKGLLCVMADDNNELICYDQCDWPTEQKGLLRTVFKNGKLIKETSLEEIRTKIKNHV